MPQTNNLLTIYYSILLQAVIKFFTNPLRKIPGPWFSRFTEIPYMYFVLRGDITRHHLFLLKKYGPITRVRPNCVIISNNKEFKKVLATYRYKKSYVYEGFANLEQSIFSTRDENFNRMRRRQVGPAFSQTGLDSVDSLITEICVDSFEKKLREIIQEGNGVVQFNFFKYFQNVTADVIGELAFGKSFDAVQNDGHPITDWVNTAMKNFILFKSFPILKLLQYIYPGLRKNEKKLENFCLESIEQRRRLIKNKSYNEKRIDILQMYLTSINTSNNQPLSDSEIVTEMVTMVIAGVDTTSITMTWLLTFYLLYPEVYNKVREEIRSNFPDKNAKITLQSSREKLPYFIATVYETLRIRGSVGSALMRDIPIDRTEICGYEIPKNVLIGMSIPGSNNDPELWENPDSFNPDRFLGPEGERLKKEITAFSTGVRICPGKNLAWMEIAEIIANMLNNFDLELPSDSMYGPNILDAGRHNEPLLPKDVTFATRPPAYPDRDCNVIIKERAS
ncbi:Versicolorin B desaturase [Smittium culicis]|uniref:Versicolorin B desaturase n=1 Tax=Smittium culicis TaxID=133412 RepID=A0A1R1YB44_9FUNG|nr:Versicolorin B desaturase [Smittium culicis]